MKKSVKLKRKTIRLIVKNLIVLVVLVAVAAAGVRSWYNEEDAKRADAKGLANVKCSVPDGMEIAIVAPGTTPDNNTVWHDSDFIINAQNYSFLETLSLTEITGDGKTFIKPPITQYSSVAYPDTSSTADWSNSAIQTTPNDEYLSFDVYFRTLSAGSKVVLDEESICCPSTTVTDWGNVIAGWNPDTVIGAARVSVVESNTTRRLLWIPAPFLYYDPVRQTTDQLETNVTNTGYGSAGGNRGLYYYIGQENNQPVYGELNNDGTYNHGYWENKTTRSQIYYGTNPATDVTANTYKDYKLHKDVDVMTFPNTTTNYTVSGNSVAYYSGYARVNIWIEGEDPESRSTQLTGSIKAVLNFEIKPASS